jgi:hypothetical protein
MKRSTGAGGQEVRGLTAAGFLRRLGAGRAVNCIYRTGELAGLISAWRYEAEFVLTWEECRDGDQENENLYTRDERRLFGAPEAVLEFVEGAGFPASSFGP